MGRDTKKRYIGERIFEEGWKIYTSWIYRQIADQISYTEHKYLYEIWRQMKLAREKKEEAYNKLKGMAQKLGINTINPVTKEDYSAEELKNKILGKLSLDDPNDETGMRASAERECHNYRKMADEEDEASKKLDKYRRDRQWGETEAKFEEIYKSDYEKRLQEKRQR